LSLNRFQLDTIESTRGLAYTGHLNKPGPLEREDERDGGLIRKKWNGRLRGSKRVSKFVITESTKEKKKKKKKGLVDRRRLGGRDLHQ